MEIFRCSGVSLFTAARVDEKRYKRRSYLYCRTVLCVHDPTYAGALVRPFKVNGCNVLIDRL